MRHKIPHQLRKLCKPGHIVSWKTKSRCFSTSRGIKSQFKHQVKAQAARENPGISKSQGLQSEIKNQVIKAQAVRKDQRISTSQGIQLELTNQAIKVQAPKEFEDPSIRTSQDIKTDFKHQFKAQAARKDPSIKASQDIKTDFKHQFKAQAARMDSSIRTSQDIKTDFKHQFKAQAARKDPSIRTSQDIKTDFKHQFKAQAARKDPSIRTSQETRIKTTETRPNRIKMENPANETHRPSSTLNEPKAPILYGENIDYAIRIVEHFVNFLPGGKFFS